MILFSSTPEIFKTPKAPKRPLFKTSKEKKFRHSPTYSISDFTRKCRRSGNGHNWDYWHQEGGKEAIISFIPGLSWKSHITYLGDLPTEQNRSPIWQPLLPREQIMSRGGGKANSSPVRSSYATRNHQTGACMASLLTLPESQELPASEASRLGRRRRSWRKCRLFWQFRQ